MPIKDAHELQLFPAESEDVAGMTDPFLLVQLSAPHIGATWGPGDPLAGLAAAVDSVRALEFGPSAVLLSGDLADHAADDEYEHVRDLLAPPHALSTCWPATTTTATRCVATSACPVRVGSRVRGGAGAVAAVPRSSSSQPSLRLSRYIGCWTESSCRTSSLSRQGRRRVGDEFPGRGRSMAQRAVKEAKRCRTTVSEPVRNGPQLIYHLMFDPTHKA